MYLPPSFLSIFLVIETALLLFLTFRTWTYPLARFFVLVGVSFWLFNLGSTFRLITNSFDLAWIGLTVESLSLVALSFSLMLATSRAFAPGWWIERGPLLGLTGIYLVWFGLLAIDLLGQFGWFVQGMSQVNNTYEPRITSNLTVIIFMSSWVPSLIMLAIALLRRRVARFLGAVLSIPSGLLFLTGLGGSPLPRTVMGEINIQLLLGIPILLAILYVARVGQGWLVEGIRLDLALDALDEAVVMVDRQGEVNYTNAKAQTLGVRPGQLLPEALQATGISSAEIETKIGNLETSALTFITPDQEIELKVATVQDEQGQRQGSVLVSHDIGELERRNQLLEQERARLDEAVNRLNFLATHDGLTGLPNRSALVERLELDIARIKSQGKFPGWESFRSPYTIKDECSVLLFLDLDNFKLVNDTLGHGVGDQLLIDVSQLIHEQLRPRDLLARFGGDEFAILLHAVSFEQAQQMAWRLCHSVENFRYKADGQQFELGLSIGLVIINEQMSAQVVLTQADIAMYSAKAQGRNRVVVYTQQNSSIMELSDANQWAAQIKDALSENRMLLHYQPIVRLSDRSISHYEALIRMRDRQGQLIMPALFITAVERFGLMAQVNRWIVQEVLRMLAANPGVSMYLNLSSRSLVDEGLLQFIEDEVEQSDVAPTRLGFEITENLPIDDIQQAERCILRLKKMGCTFALDDFGAGFNSFAYLGSLSVDKIKIDGSFIRSLDQDYHNQAIVRAVHNLAAGLGKETVAEFVQNEATAQLLHSIGITYGQGYQLGRPSPTLTVQTLATA